MSVDRVANHQTQHAILKAFAPLTDRAVGLFESTEDGGVKEILPSEGFEAYCKKIQSLGKGKRLCRKDHIRRAKRVIKSGNGELDLCYAGVFNQSLPIAVDDKTRAVLMYGQMWIEEDERCAKAREYHERVIRRLRPTKSDELELRSYYKRIKRFSKDELEILNQRLSLLQHLFYEKLSEEQEWSRQVESVIHEIQTRLEPVLTQAEYICFDLRRISKECRQVESLVPIAEELLNGTLAMRTIVRNLGDFLPGECQFKTVSLRQVVEEAVALYGAEAKRRNIDILTQLEWPAMIEMSLVHLQEAINNLLHNAIKYSFRGSRDRYRYVKIDGETDGSYYVLSISNYGVGILPEEMDIIFKPGYQGKLARGEYRSGAGKGLTIAKNHIEKHHGMIEVQSVEKGDRAYANQFIVRLPLKQP